MKVMVGLDTVPGWSQAVGKSQQFARMGIALKKLKAQKVGGQYLIPESEKERFKKNPFTITREEIARYELAKNQRHSQAS